MAEGKSIWTPASLIFSLPSAYKQSKLNIYLFTGILLRYYDVLSLPVHRSCEQVQAELSSPDVLQANKLLHPQMFNNVL